MKLSGNNYSSNPFASSNRIMKIEVSRAKDQKRKIARERTLEPPTESQVQYLNFLFEICEKYDMPYERSKMIAMRSKNEATAIIKQLQMVFQQRGISYKYEDNPDIAYKKG